MKSGSLANAPDLVSATGNFSRKAGLDQLFFEIEREERGDLRSYNKQLQSDRERMIKDNQDLRTQIELLQMQLNTKTIEINEVRAQLLIANQSNAKVQQELQRAEADITNLKAALKVATDSVKMATEIRINKKEADLQALAGYRTELMEMQKKLAAAERDNAALQGRLQKLEFQPLEIEALRRAHHELEQEKHVLTLRLADSELRASLAASQSGASHQARFDAEDYVRRMNLAHQVSDDLHHPQPFPPTRSA